MSAGFNNRRDEYWNRKREEDDETRNTRVRMDFGRDFNKGSDEEETYCFPGQAKVQTEDGRQVPISHVTPGTSVLARDPSGAPVYSPIYFQTHADPDAQLDCVRVEAGDTVLELSGGHYLLLGGRGDDGDKTRDVTAREVKTGDLLLVYDHAKQAFRPAPVTSVERVQRRGMYAPLTLQGSIVVDGVACSCYTDACRLAPSTAHGLLWPVRQLWQVSPGSLALLTKPCDQEGRPAVAEWVLRNILGRLPTSSPL